MTNRKPWWASKTLYGVLMIVLGIIAQRAGWNWGAGEEAAVGGIVTELLQLVGVIVATYGRLTATEKLRR